MLPLSVICIIFLVFEDNYPLDSQWLTTSTQMTIGESKINLANQNLKKIVKKTQE